MVIFKIFNLSKIFQQIVDLVRFGLQVPTHFLLPVVLSVGLPASLWCCSDLWRVYAASWGQSSAWVVVCEFSSQGLATLTGSRSPDAKPRCEPWN